MLKYIRHIISFEEKDTDEKSERHELETVKRLRRSRWQKRHMVEGDPTTKCVTSHLLK